MQVSLIDDGICIYLNLEHAPSLQFIETEALDPYLPLSIRATVGNFGAILSKLPTLLR